MYLFNVRHNSGQRFDHRIREVLVQIIQKRVNVHIKKVKSHTLAYQILAQHEHNQVTRGSNFVRAIVDTNLKRDIYLIVRIQNGLERNLARLGIQMHKLLAYGIDKLVR